jgi:tetratricopeptide (TPR) repeat protein
MTAAICHQLGMVAEERQQFDQAEQWYRRALGIFERLGHSPLLVNTLAQVGVLERRRGRPVEAIPWYGRALATAAKYQMRVSDQILADLAVVLNELGEDAFITACRQAFGGQEPPLEAIRAAGTEADSD